MTWTVYFLAIGLSLPDGISARFHAKFETQDQCEQWVTEVGKLDPPKIEVISGCQPDFPTPEQQKEFFDGLRKGLEKAFPNP